MKVYVTTFNGYKPPRGAQIYLLGVFSSKSEAELAVMNAEIDKEVFPVTIREVELDVAANILYYGKDIATGHYLGGYEGRR